MVSHSWAFAPVATATPNYANFRQRKPAPVSTGASEQAGALLAVPTVSREGGGAQSPRAAVPTPEMLTLRACLRSILFSPVVPGMAPPPARARHSSGSVEARAPSACFVAGKCGSAACWERLLTAGFCFLLRRHLGRPRYCMAGCGMS